MIRGLRPLWQSNSTEGKPSKSVHLGRAECTTHPHREVRCARDLSPHSSGLRMECRERSKPHRIRAAQPGTRSKTGTPSGTWWKRCLSMVKITIWGPP